MYFHLSLNSEMLIKHFQAIFLLHFPSTDNDEDGGTTSSTVGKFGWCGTCHSNEPGKPGFCKHLANTENEINTTMTAGNTNLTENQNEFSQPNAKENWGFCSENCLKLNENEGHSEVGL